jgi:hypothetical protein
MTCPSSAFEQLLCRQLQLNLKITELLVRAGSGELPERKSVWTRNLREVFVWPWSKTATLKRSFPACEAE